MLDKEFQFIFKGNIFFGRNSRLRLNELFQNENWGSTCIIIDQGIINLPIIDQMLQSLIGIQKIIIECDVSEPSYEKLEENRFFFKNQTIDVFIGIGGGSALDMAKGLAVLYANDGPAISYRGFEMFKEPIPSIIGIPTTAGTGSEITPNASFIDTYEKRKMGINGEGIRPKYSILDPELTLTCPKEPTISAGVDSIVHATEAFVAKKSNPMAKLFAKEGFNLVFKNLPLLIDDLESIKLREKVMYGAFLSAVALMNSGTGPAAAMSYPLGVHFGVPHGLGGSIFLPFIMEHNIKAGCFDYSDLVLNPNSGLSKQEISIEFMKKIWSTWEQLKIPNNLRVFGMNENKIDKFISDTIELKGALDQNPIPFYEDEIKNTLNYLLNP